MTTPLKSLFLLDPAVTFLNHGSFGACPAPVFEAYGSWQRRLENQPVLLLNREHHGLLREARYALGKYLNADGDDLAFVPNATHGVNIVARSLNLQPGDEILTSNHEYGACVYTWEYLCQRSGARFVQQPIDLPTQSSEEIYTQFWGSINERTRVIYLSHITSPTALRLPVEQICKAARERGILTVIDGAHAPGQIPLDLSAIDADFYTGNCHKWMLSPKGAGFLYARRSVQHLVQPLTVSWGRHSTPEESMGSQFQNDLTWTGTYDPSAYLSVPAAIRFLEEYNWAQVTRDCHTLLREYLPRLHEVTGMPAAYPDDSDLYSQMAVVILPPGTDIKVMKSRLYDEFRVEVPLIDWNGMQLMRVSVQGYNDAGDLERLVEALQHILRTPPGVIKAHLQ